VSRFQERRVLSKQQDLDWVAPLPKGEWVKAEQIQGVWGLSRTATNYRLSLLRVSGVALHKGRSYSGRWWIPAKYAAGR
jgi:hypothetical protein